MIQYLDHPEEKKLVIDLDGEDGNAFFLLARARDLAKQLNLNPDKISKEMQKTNYKHLVKTFDKHFGAYVVLQTSDSNLIG